MSRRLPPVTLVLGGARSGKSRHGETLIRRAARRGLYVATAEAGDAEMAARIAQHRQDRGDTFWETREEPHALAAVLRAERHPARPVLVDCLTLWLVNRQGAGADLAAETADLAAALRAGGGPVVLVSNEVGLGLVPADPESRAYRDALGRLHQAVAAVASAVTLVVAGQPLALKAPPRRVWNRSARCAPPY